MQKSTLVAMGQRRLCSTLSSTVLCGKRSTPLWRLSVHRMVAYMGTAAPQNTTLQRSTSRSSLTTKFSQGRFSLTSLGQLRIHLTLHSLFPLSFHHQRRVALQGSLYCIQPPVPFFARRLSLSSLAFHGDPWPTYSLVPPRPQHTPMSVFAYHPSYRTLVATTAELVTPIRLVVSLSCVSALQCTCTVPCRTVSDREAMHQLVDCIGLT
jgi:hypothetical protein